MQIDIKMRLKHLSILSLWIVNELLSWPLQPQFSSNNVYTPNLIKTIALLSARPAISYWDTLPPYSVIQILIYCRYIVLYTCSPGLGKHVEATKVLPELLSNAQTQLFFPGHHYFPQLPSAWSSQSPADHRYPLLRQDREAPGLIPWRDEPGLPTRWQGGCTVQFSTETNLAGLWSQIQSLAHRYWHKIFSNSHSALCTSATPHSMILGLFSMEQKRCPNWSWSSDLHSNFPPQLVMTHHFLHQFWPRDLW